MGSTSTSLHYHANAIILIFIYFRQACYKHPKIHSSIRNLFFLHLSETWSSNQEYSLKPRHFRFVKTKRSLLLSLFLFCLCVMYSSKQRKNTNQQTVSSLYVCSSICIRSNATEDYNMCCNRERDHGNRNRRLQPRGKVSTKC